MRHTITAHPVCVAGGYAAAHGYLPSGAGVGYPGRHHLPNRLYAALVALHPDHPWASGCPNWPLAYGSPRVTLVARLPGVPTPLRWRACYLRKATP